MNQVVSTFLETLLCLECLHVWRNKKIFFIYWAKRSRHLFLHEPPWRPPGASHDASPPAPQPPSGRELIERDSLGRTRRPSMPDTHPPRRQTLLRTSPRSFLRFLCNTRPSKFQPRNLTPPAPLSLSSTSEPLGLERPHLERSVGQPKEISELADDERSQSSSLTPAFDKSPFVGPTGKKTRPVGNASLLTKWCLTVFPDKLCQQTRKCRASMQDGARRAVRPCAHPAPSPRPRQQGWVRLSFSQTVRKTNALSLDGQD